jgi:hypothetical protein
MTDKQPEALRLADRLEADAQGVNLGAEGMGWEPSANNMHDAATELRRLHEVNAELVEALRPIAEQGEISAKIIANAKAAIAKATGEQNG